MQKIRNILIDRVKNATHENFPSIVRKAIHEGVVKPEDLRYFADRTRDFLDKLTIPQITSLLHSFSLPIYRNFELFTNLTNRLHVLLSDSIPSVEDNIKIINSCGRLRYTCSHVLDILVKHLEGDMDLIKPRSMTAILHSLTRLKYHDLKFLEKLAVCMLSGLPQLTEVEFANFSIAVSKVYVQINNQGESDAEKTPSVEQGEIILSAIVTEILNRAPLMSPMDSLRHIIALSNLKNVHGEKNLSTCVTELAKRINCAVLYYEHLVLLLECLVSLNVYLPSFLFPSLIPSILDKRDDPKIASNITLQIELRLLDSITTFPSINESCNILVENISTNILNLLEESPQLIKYVFEIFNKMQLDTDDLLQQLESLLENKPKFGNFLDKDAKIHISTSISKSSQQWPIISDLLDKNNMQ
ncbi:conserved hypothetical protein [Theileria equi strain WA]|uniref:Uncharacterized protein n=1 Tax=Theileria equi strain WA TaxID=1537102 RepID=L1LCU4_THEEQ|nr:conserved hypothetical protein [Theileria equi strain WA]EKX73104.1 conserved hypothetical protein [Theileria equi strain WA]|eukprot:XP_004832556.1 conserved hypothetical protein [Theileria equi strain WA]